MTTSERGDPPDKLWGGRFAKPTARTVEAFTSSLAVDRRLAPHDLVGSMAHCAMLVRQHIIPQADGRAILQGLAELASELPWDGKYADSSWEDVHSLVEGLLRERIGEAAGRLHTGRSRNDQVALDERLFARQALAQGVVALTSLQAALVDVARRHADVALPGYTHLQRAQPVLLSHHLLAYVQMLSRDAGRLRDAYSRANVSPLGAGALAGAPYPLDRHYVADLLGFAAISANSIDAVSDRDFLLEHLSALALVAVHLSRLAEELVLWSTAEFGFVEMDDGYATGSSIMPQKKNPDVAELVRGRSGRVIGALVGLLTVVKGLPLSYNRDLQEDKESYFDAVDTVLACLTLSAEMVRSMQVRAERMESAAESSFSTATDLADHLVVRGLAFRDAHQVVGAAVRWCIAHQRELPDLELAELRQFSGLFDESAVGVRAHQSVESRNIPGGTSPEQVQLELDRAEQSIQSVAAWASHALGSVPDPAELAAQLLASPDFEAPGA